MLTRWIRPTIVLLAAACGVGLTFVVTRNAELRRLNAEVQRLEQDKKQLAEFAERLGASRRVAQVEVVNQRSRPDGTVMSVMLWHEVAADGSLGQPQYVETSGGLVYLEAAVVKFQTQLVGAGDVARGTSLALFRRIFGECQTPSSAAELDRTTLASAKPGTDRPTLEPRLWEIFWQLMDDPALAEQYGVRVAQVEAPAVVVHTGQVFEVTLDAAGGLNVRLLGRRQNSRPAAAEIAFWRP